MDRPVLVQPDNVDMVLVGSAASHIDPRSLELRGSIRAYDPTLQELTQRYDNAPAIAVRFHRVESGLPASRDPLLDVAELRGRTTDGEYFQRRRLLCFEQA